MSETTPKNLPKTQRGLLSRLRKRGCPHCAMQLAELFLRQGKLKDALDMLTFAMANEHSEAAERATPIMKRKKEEDLRLWKMKEAAYAAIAKEFSKSA